MSNRRGQVCPGIPGFPYNHLLVPSSPIGHNVTSKEEVDEVMEQAAKAGASIVKPADETFWGGYSGYFQDPDGHLWEVVWNPAYGLPE